MVEPALELIKEFVPDIDRRSGHADCVMEYHPLVIGKRWIFLKAPECLQLGVRQTALPADRRPDVDSEWATDHHGHFYLDECLKLGRHGLGGLLAQFHVGQRP